MATLHTKLGVVKNERRVQIIQKGALGESYSRCKEATQIVAQQQLVSPDGNDTITTDIIYSLAYLYRKSCGYYGWDAIKGRARRRVQWIFF